MPLYVPEAPAGTHDCYLRYVDANTIRLERFGGNKLMINGNLETIPDNLTVGMYPGWAGNDALQVVAMMSGGEMILTYFNDAIIIDANGMAVMQSRPDLTIVGMVLGRQATFVMSDTECGVISYWNRRQRCFGRYDGQGTNSTVDVILSSFTRRFVAFGGAAIRMAFSGYVSSDVPANDYMSIGRLHPNGTAGGIGHSNNSYSANNNWANSVGPHADIIAGAVNSYGDGGRYEMRIHALVSGGTGTWVGFAGVTLEG